MCETCRKVAGPVTRAGVTFASIRGAASRAWRAGPLVARENLREAGWALT